MYLKSLAALGLVAALTACGTTPTERAVTGGAMGAATGAAGAAVLGGDPAAGAAVGAGTGALGGALTDPDDVYLGEPVWDRWF